MEFPIGIHILYFAKITKFPQNHLTVSSEIAIHLVTITLIKICHVFYRIHPFTKKKINSVSEKSPNIKKSKEIFFYIILYINRTFRIFRISHKCINIRGLIIVIHCTTKALKNRCYVSSTIVWIDFWVSNFSLRSLLDSRFRLERNGLTTRTGGERLALRHTV